MQEDALDFLQNSKNFELKNIVDEEVSNLLYSLQKELDDLLDSGEYTSRFKRSKLPGKIAKGNNHYGYPYQVLDYPAILSKEASFSFRTSIWYGHYFSFALILVGRFKEEIKLDVSELRKKEFQFTTDPNIWETDTSKHQSKPLQNFHKGEWENLIKENNQIKIFKCYSLNQTPMLIRLGKECFQSLLLV